jgi:UDP-N-acetylmuramoylalanine--D-glutamate ligase
MILNRDDDWSMANGRCGRKIVTFGLDPAPRGVDYGHAEGAIWRGKERIVAVDELHLAGLHNVANAMAALALGEAVGAAPARMLGPLKGFTGLPHRVEPVAEIGGVLYVDDSKGTNVGATLAAISGMGRKVAIVLGGDGKGQDFAPLKPALARHGRAAALIGKDAALIEAAVAGCGVPLQRVAAMDEAVRWLAGQAQAGDCVLLSPACASLDMYRSYAERAEAFVAAVRGMRP